MGDIDIRVSVKLGEPEERTQLMDTVDYVHRRVSLVCLANLTSSLTPQTCICCQVCLYIDGMR